MDAYLGIPGESGYLQTYRNLINGIPVDSEAVTPTDSRGTALEHHRDFNNEQVNPLAPNAVFDGTFTYVGGITHHEILYAATTPFTAVKIWSNDGVTPIPGIFGTSVLTPRVVSGYNVIYDVNEGRNIAPYYRIQITNGSTGQGPVPFFISLVWLQQSPYVGSFGFLTDQLNNLSKALLTRSVIAGINPDGTFGNVNLDPAASISTSQRGLPVWNVRQFIASSVPSQADITKLFRRKAIQITNHSATLNMYIGPTSNIASDQNSELIPPLTASSMLLNELGSVWVVSDPGGSSATFTRSGGSSAGTATNPNNALSDDSAYSIITAASQTILLSAYTAGTSNALTSVKLGIKGRKAASPATETVAFLASVTGTSTSNSVTSATVNAVNNTLYVACISTRDPTVIVNSVTGLGLTWTIAGGGATGTANRTTMWSAYGSPAASGTVVAVLSGTTNSNIAVNSYSNGASPVSLEGYTTLTGSTGTYSGSITGTNLGMTILGIGMNNATESPGSGATQRSSTSVGTGSNTNTLATTTNPNTGTTESFSGTVSTGAWSLVVASIVPVTTVSPVVTISYKLSGVAGFTTQNVSFSTTSDVTTLVDITPDRSWVAADIANVQWIGTGQSITTANAEINYGFIQVTDSSGNSVRYSLKEIGDNS